MNYFNFYELPVKFHLDEKKLKERYFSFLKSNHPDFFVHDAEKYHSSLVQSSLNNEAFKCLSNFYLRANYILTISNIELDEKLPSDFLMEMMEINETLDTLQFEPNSLQLTELNEQIQSLDIGLETELQNLTSKADLLESMDNHLMKEIKEILLKHKYILRIKETLANIAAP